MQSHYPERFVREMGCTQVEWLRWLQAAMGDVAWRREGLTAQATWPTGCLTLQWEVLPDRVIAQVRLPVLQVQFHFQGLETSERFRFMKRFDLYMQRGGG